MKEGRRSRSSEREHRNESRDRRRDRDRSRDDNKSSRQEGEPDGGKDKKRKERDRSKDADEDTSKDSKSAKRHCAGVKRDEPSNEPTEVVQAADTIDEAGGIVVEEFGDMSDGLEEVLSKEFCGESPDMDVQGQAVVERVEKEPEEVETVEELKMECLLFQEFGDKFNQPIIGLEYVSEIKSHQPNTRPTYHCKLCTTKGASTIMVIHVLGYKHKLEYMKKHKPILYDEIMMLPTKRARIKLLMSEAKHIKDTEERGAVSVNKLLNPEDHDDKITLAPPESVQDVWILGDSIPHLAGQRAISLGQPNLNLPDGTSIFWWGISSLGWGNFLYSIKLPMRLRPPPKVVLIHMGGDDLNRHTTIFIFRYLEYCIEQLMYAFPDTHFVWVDILQRINWGVPKEEIPAIENKRKRVNQFGRKQVHVSSPDCHNLRIKIDFKTPSFYKDDGVHLSDKGLDVYIDAIREILLSIIA